ncbi:MAG: biotin transporter BioY [Microbacteriaceae bacterium]|nr:MAG: biotin transporter BioY [Microbacteriaceae bacterium]
MSPRAHIDVRDLTRIAVFAAIIAVLGLPAPISVFGGAVPITAQTLGVMLAGAILGSWRGAAAVTTFLVLVAVGLPLLSGGHGGIGVFVGPTAGYLFGWIVGAFVTGAVVHPSMRAAARGNLRRPSWARIALGCVIGGILVVYTFGIPVSAFVTGLPLPQMALGSLVFVPGDLIKAAVATIVTLVLWRAYPQAVRPRTTDAATRVAAVSAATETSDSAHPDSAGPEGAHPDSAHQDTSPAGAE